MSQTATKDDVRNLGETLRDEIRENTREIIGHFNKSQGAQNERLERIENRLEEVGEDVSKIKLAVVDLMATDRHMHNLVGALKREGISLNDNEIFR